MVLGPVTPKASVSKREKQATSRKSLESFTELPSLSAQYKAALQRAERRLKFAYDLLGMRSREVVSAVHHVVVAARHTMLALPTGS